MTTQKKYVKPTARSLNDLTPALGLCASGALDGGCTPGNAAGGTQGCGSGSYATGIGGSCHPGNVIYGPGSTCTSGSNRGG
jgi:hypothetical protein